jgi:hypothetical protein
LYQFILTKISGEPRTAISHRNLENWDELKEFPKNTYIEKRTFDFHANQLFKARQNKSETISEWIQKIQTLGSKFRESALQNCTEEERAGILTLADKLRNICFIQGLCSDRIQTIVRSRNNESFDDTAETALEEESAIVSKQERYKGEIGTPIKCGRCGKVGHSTQTCFLKKTTKVGPTHNSQARVSQAGVERMHRPLEVTCYNCNRKGHYARNCRMTRQKFSKRKHMPRIFGKREPAVGRQPTDGQQHAIGCVNTTKGDFIELKLDISEEKGLLLLLDTEAEVSVVKSQKLIGSTRFDPQQKIKLKSVDGLVVETYGLVEAKVKEGSRRIPISLQFVHKQLDIEGDGILGKDFLLRTRAQICYEQKRVNFKWQNSRFEKPLRCYKEAENREETVRTMTLNRLATIGI